MAAGVGGDSRATPGEPAAGSAHHPRRPQGNSAPDESQAIDDRPGAYQWWYFDATSDDGAWTLVVIFFVGSVFSPWYARRLGAGAAPRPREHAAVNVALYQRGTRGPRRWCFSEYPERDLAGHAAPTLRVGRSAMHIGRDGRYALELDETPPLLAPPFPIRGRVCFERAAPAMGPLCIDPAGEHRWLPAAPRCAVTAELRAPALRFTGAGYHDVNHGDVPLARSFARWTWCRVHGADATRIAYDRVARDGTRRVLSVHAPHDARTPARWSDRAEPAAQERVRGAWGLAEPRILAVDAETLADVTRAEASPFYARYLGRTAAGAPAVAEHLDLTRFEAPWVRALVPFRARRVR